MLDRKVNEALDWLRAAKEKFREFASGEGHPPNARPKIGLALAGGFARGIAHIGVLQVFRNAGIPIDCVAGTSVGALIGAGFCAGTPLERMIEIGNTTTFADFGRWNVVPPFRDSGAHTRDVKFSAAEAGIPYSDFDLIRQCLLQQRGNRVAAQSCLEGEVQSLGYGALQQAFAFPPGSAACICLGDARIGGENVHCGVIRIEIPNALAGEHGSGNAALTRAVRAG